MTDPDYRHYLLIVDRSGSMASIKGEAQNGIRFFAREQSLLPGRATMTLCQFDSDYEVVHDFAPLSAVASYELLPRGATALLHACGTAITSTGERLAAMPEHQRPGKVFVLITTDGEENTPGDYTRDQVREMITRQQEEYGWQFSYVGANVDSFAEAASIGIAANSTLDYLANAAGAASAYSVASAAVGRVAQGQSASVTYTDQERKAAKGTS